MTTELDFVLGKLASVTLPEMNEEAAMLHRKDRKYLIGADELAAILAGLPSDTRSLETEAGRWATYQSTYLDTPDLDLFVLAVRRRPSRCKVRLRHYVDSGLAMAEVKTKDRANHTVKHRHPVCPIDAGPFDHVTALASRVCESATYASALQPTLTTRYRRATLLLPAGGGRATIDLDCVAADANGRRTGLGDLMIVETKTNGRPSPLDRLLWRAGHRPTRYSKYCTAMAALTPGLPANRWHRVMTKQTKPQLRQGTHR